MTMEKKDGDISSQEKSHILVFLDICRCLFNLIIVGKPLLFDIEKLNGENTNS